MSGQSVVTVPALKPGFLRNVVHLASGSILGSAALVLSMPLLTRLVPPDEFGRLSLFLAAYSILAGLLTFKYELSIILPKEYEDAVALTRLTVASSGALSAALLFAMLIVRWWSPSVCEWPYLLLPLATFLSAAICSAQQWASRTGDYARYSRSQAIGPIVNVGVCLALALLCPNCSGSLIVGYVCGLFAATLYATAPFAGRLAREPVANGTRRSAWRLIVEYREFPLYVLPSSLVVALGLNAIPVLLKASYPLAEVGQYAVANRFLQIPSAVIGAAITEAFRSEYVRRCRADGDTHALLSRTLVRLVAISLPAFACFALVTPALFPRLLGAEYEHSGLIARTLCIAACAQFVAQPFAYVFIAHGRARLAFALQATAAILPLVGLLGIGHGIDVAILAYSVLTLVTCSAVTFIAYATCRAARCRREP